MPTITYDHYYKRVLIYLDRAVPREASILDSLARIAVELSAAFGKKVVFDIAQEYSPAGPDGRYQKLDGRFTLMADGGKSTNGDRIVDVGSLQMSVNHCRGRNPNNPYETMVNGIVVWLTESTS